MLILCIVFYPLNVYAENIEYYEEDGKVHKDMVVIEGKVYILTTPDEARKAVSNSQELSSERKKSALLQSKIDSMEEVIESQEEIIELYRTELGFNYDYIEKSKGLAEKPFYETVEFGLVAGVLTTTMMFFLWKYAEGDQR